jgi:hypothetical protein
LKIAPRGRRKVSTGRQNVAPERYICGAKSEIAPPERRLVTAERRKVSTGQRKVSTERRVCGAIFILAPRFFAGVDTFPTKGAEIPQKVIKLAPSGAIFARVLNLLLLVETKEV